jgi:hypothetical protein
VDGGANGATIAEMTFPLTRTPLIEFAERSGLGRGGARLDFQLAQLRKSVSI